MPPAYRQWVDRDFLQHLAVYDGRFVKAVRDNPERFVRDDFEMLRVVTERTSAGRATRSNA